MNQNILEGKWMQLRGSIREKWGELTDDELGKGDTAHRPAVEETQEFQGRPAVGRLPEKIGQE